VVLQGDNLFGKKKDNNRMPEKERRIREILSREYKIYQEEERWASLPQTLYEKACRVSERILHLEPDKKSKKTLQEAIDFSLLRATPAGIASFTILFAFLTTFPVVILIVLHAFGYPGLSLGYGLIAITMSLFVTVYLYMYPFTLKKMYAIRAGSDIVSLVLYMCIYMRTSPNLEGAVRMASENLTGPLAYELRKLMWDIEVGNYTNIEDALSDFTNKWSANKSFSEAVQIMMTSLSQNETTRLKMLDEAMDVVLRGARESARHYNQALKLPVMVIHAMGIVLPIMGLVLFPVVAVFLKVPLGMLFVGYDILLPFVVFFVIQFVLEERPPTFSQIDISENPDIPPSGKFRLDLKNRGMFLPAWPFGLLASVFFILLGILILPSSPEGIVPAIVISMGLAVGPAIYCLLLSFQRLDVRSKVMQMENEFAEALYQIGNHIRGGTTIELALQQSLTRMGDLKIKDLFQKALNNVRKFGMTLKDAFFHKSYGAVRYYPSKIIKSTMNIVIQSTAKGIATGGAAMLSISRYLKNLHKTQEEVQTHLNDVLSSLKFQAYFLSPAVSGIVVMMAILIIRIIRSLSERIGSFQMENMIPLFESWNNLTVTPFEFLLIVSIYMIETSIILSLFINGIENGDDPIGLKYTVGKILIIGFVVFTISFFTTLIIFGPLILGILAS
jgi:Flp pilus assembly protein TadB